MLAKRHDYLLRLIEMSPVPNLQTAPVQTTDASRMIAPRDATGLP
jgi:hypothetical protein